MKKILKKALSLILSLSMLTGIVPLSVSAETVPEEEPATYTIDLSDPYFEDSATCVLKGGSLVQNVKAGEPIETVIITPVDGYTFMEESHEFVTMLQWAAGVLYLHDLSVKVSNNTITIEGTPSDSVKLHTPASESNGNFEFRWPEAYPVDNLPTLPVSKYQNCVVDLGNCPEHVTVVGGSLYQTVDLYTPMEKVYIVPNEGYCYDYWHPTFFFVVVMQIYNSLACTNVYTSYVKNEQFPDGAILFEGLPTTYFVADLKGTVSGGEELAIPDPILKTFKIDLGTLAENTHGDGELLQTVSYFDEMVTVKVTPDEGYYFDDSIKEFVANANAEHSASGIVFELVDGSVIVSGDPNADVNVDGWPAPVCDEPTEPDKPSVNPGPGYIIIDDDTAADKPEETPDENGVIVNLLNTYDHFDYLHGYPNGTFAAGRSMTRAEAAQMFYNLLIDQNVETTVEFIDVPENAWYTKAVNTLASLGIIEGVGNGKFQPQRTINRAEFAAMIVRFSDTEISVSNIFNDVKESAWYYEPVMTALSYGWIGGYHDGTFRPRNDVTRAEVATIVNRMLCRTADRTYVTTHSHAVAEFTDLSESHWAYYPIIEAATSHDFLHTNSTERWTGLR